MKLLPDEPDIPESLMEVDAVGIVYSITDASSFQSVPAWWEIVHKFARPGTNLMLIGHKADQGELREVTEQEAQGISDNLGVKLQETSARHSETVLAAYDHLVHMVIKRRERERGSGDEGEGSVVSEGPPRAESFRREGI